GNLAGAQLGAIARPYLRDLVAELGESANVATMDGDMVVYVDQVASQRQMRMFTEVGRRAHMHDTGVGKAILAGLEADQVRHIVTTAGMPTPTEYSLGTLSELESELELIRDRGYAIDEQEQELGVRCFAMAIPDAPAPLAISVSGPISRDDQAFADPAVPLPLRLTLPSSPPRPHLNGRACRSPSCNGGAPRPPCLHDGLGAPPLFRLAPQSSAVVSGTSRGLGLGRFPQPEAANRI